MTAEDRFGFICRGTARQYVAQLRRELYRYRQIFHNIESAFNNHLEFDRVYNKPNSYYLELGRIFLKPGDNVVELMGEGVEFPLTFVDSSILSISQTFEESANGCYLEKSVIAFNKVKNDRVAYIFHFDSQQGVPDHPDYHLQFDFSNEFNTPRFDVHSYASIESILAMIMRDHLIR